MKILKLLLPICACACLASPLMASENDSIDEKKSFFSSINYHPYSAYEINQLGYTYPSLGCKTQWKKLIIDTSVGYKYLYLGSNQVYSVNISGKILYNFFTKNSFHSYAGIGATKLIDFYKSKGRGTQHYFLPSIIFGNQVKINDEHSIFFEFIYKPRVYGSWGGKTIHEDSFRIGLMY